MKKIIIPEAVYYQGKIQTGLAVLITEDEITEIDTLEKIKETCGETAVETEYWENMVMLPGTVNVHNHSFQSLLRGLAVGKPFLVWRDEALYKISPMLTPEDIYVGALFAFGEMMKYGVTTVCDFFYLHNNGIEGDHAIIRAAKDVGIRLVLARTMYDWKGAPSGYVESIDDAVSNTRLLANEFNGKNGQMTTVLPAPHSLHAATPEMVIAGHELSKELGTKFHIHVAEEPFEVEEVLRDHGLRPVEFLDKIGVLDERMVMVHAVWLKENELSLMADKKASLAYCPSSNMFLADGVTNIAEMLKGGINIGLGSDGACSNNRISVFEEMRMASLLQKVNKLDALVVDTDESFKMGTEWGGKLLDLPVGEISVGNKADFVGIDLQDLSMLPVYPNQEQLLPNIVYSMQPNAIKRVVVEGKTTMRDGELLTVSQNEIGQKVTTLMNRIYNK